MPSADPRSRIIWQAPAAGRYYVRVRDFYQEGGRGCLAYDLISDRDPSQLSAVDHRDA